MERIFPQPPVLWRFVLMHSWLFPLAKVPPSERIANCVPARKKVSIRKVGIGFCRGN